MGQDDSKTVAAAQTDGGGTAADIVRAYRRGPALLRDAVDGMDIEQLRARPVEGKMSTLEVACHICDCDQFLADRAKRTIATERPLFTGVDATAYLGALSYHDRDLELDLRLLEVTREQMAADLDRLADEAWARTGVHTEVGLVTLRRQLLHAVTHLESHVEAIREKRRALGIG